MAKVRIEPDPAAFREMLEGKVGRAAAEEFGTKVQAAAEAAVAGLRLDDGSDVPIEGRLDTSGRPSYFVGIPHPAGLAIEAKHRPLGGALSG